MKILNFVCAAAMLILAVGEVSAQDEVHDPKAKKILDQVSKKFQGYKTLRATFDYTMENKAEKLKDSYSGYMFLKGGKYKLMLPGNEIFTDGTTMWTYLKDSKEINVTNVDKNDQSVMNPTKMFDIYKSGFKYKLEGEKSMTVKEKIDGKVTTKKAVCYVINLYPENPGKVKYHTVKIVINKSNLQIVSVTYKEKTGTDFTIEITEYKPDVAINDNLFTYDKSRYPEAELNDMR